MFDLDGAMSVRKLTQATRNVESDRHGITSLYDATCWSTAISLAMKALAQLLTALARNRPNRPRPLHSERRLQPATPPVSFAMSFPHRANQRAARFVYRNKFLPGRSSPLRLRHAARFRKHAFVASHAGEVPTRRHHCGFDKPAIGRRRRNGTHRTQPERCTRS